MLEGGLCCLWLELDAGRFLYLYHGFLSEIGSIIVEDNDRITPFVRYQDLVVLE